MILGCEHTVQYTDQVSWNYTPVTYIFILTNVTLINLSFLKSVTLELLP